MLRARVFTVKERIAAGALHALASLNLLELAVRALFVPELPLRFLVQRLFYLSALPALLVRVVWRPVRIELNGPATPWRIPLPWPGFDAGAAGIAPAVRRNQSLIKFGLVPALITLLLFRLHQLITFGGLTGEWQMFGLARWLRTLLGVAFYTWGMLILFAAGLRFLAELVALPFPRARKAAETTAAVLYYGGTAAVLISRLGF